MSTIDAHNEELICMRDFCCIQCESLKSVAKIIGKIDNIIRTTSAFSLSMYRFSGNRSPHSTQFMMSQKSKYTCSTELTTAIMQFINKNGFWAAMDVIRTQFLSHFYRTLFFIASSFKLFFNNWKKHKKIRDHSLKVEIGIYYWFSCTIACKENPHLVHDCL